MSESPSRRRRREDVAADRGSHAWNTVASMLREIESGEWLSGRGSLGAHLAALGARRGVLVRTLPGQPPVVMYSESAPGQPPIRPQESGPASHRGLPSVQRTGIRSVVAQPVEGTGTHRLTLRILANDEGSWSLYLERDPALREFREKEATLLASLQWHWARALSRQVALALTEARLAAAVEVMDHSPTGIVVLDGNGHAMTLNREARRILGECDGVLLTEGRVVVGDARCRRSFTQALNRALGNGSEHMRFSLLHVPRPSGRTPYQLTLVTRCRPGTMTFRRHPAAFVLLRDLESGRVPDPHQLHLLYGLTSAEAALCQLLYQGRSLQDAARLLNITLNTAKTHRRQAYRKIGVASQAQLVQRLVMQYWGPAEPDTSMAMPRVVA